MTRKETYNRTKKLLRKRRFLIGLVSLSTAFLITTGVSFADSDLMKGLNDWYHNKADIAIELINQSIKSDLELQKERLREEIQLKMAASSDDLNQYTLYQQQLRRERLTEYTNKLIDDMNISNEEDKKQIEVKLDQILLTAMDAINTLSTSYNPPHTVYTPSVVEELDEPINPEVEENAESSLPITEETAESSHPEMEENPELSPPAPGETLEPSPEET